MAANLHEVQRPGQRITRYEAPATLDQALELLEEHGGRARPIAGGTDLLIELARGARAGTEVLVDLGRISGLDEIRVEPATVHLGPLVTHNQVVASGACRASLTPLAQACYEVGSPQLRNRATVAGNVVTASPANDTISALLALGATVEVTSRAGTRRLHLSELITGFRTTSLGPGELVTGITVSRLSPAQRGVFVKLGLRRAQAISVVHLAATVTLDGDVVTGASFAIGSVAPTVIAVPAVGEVLAGHRLDRAAIGRAVAAVAAAIAPIDDLRAPAAYRSQVAATMTRRALAALAADQQLATWPADPPLLWRRSFDGRFPTGEALQPAVATGEALQLESATGEALKLGAATGEALKLGAATGEVVWATVNGRTVVAPAPASANLLDWLRDRAGAKGVKEGCAEGECGACTVDLDGAAVMACLVPAGRADGATIVTVEGLAGSNGDLHPVQQAFIDCGAVQCGYCTPGLLVASAMLLDERPVPTPEQVTAGLAGNLCRCTGYRAIHQAVAAAAGQASATAGDRSGARLQAEPEAGGAS
jgi:xanthine dehydrogenase iron-sulfur cluster and FAD-binding subunit A